MSRSSLINSTIGEYRLVEKLGEGGMGEVYQGVHSKIGRVVAVKILSQTALGPEFVQRFLNEARIQGGLQHNNIVTLYDFLEYNGQPCIIMEYIEGQTLTECIRAWGGLPLVDAIRYFQSILEAIDYVHSRGIVHRDIKSNNIKITPSGQVKVLDFGIAKSGASPALTVTGAFVGTLQYLSPEQLIGGVADARSDIWSLGVLLYEMTTSHLPFDANSIGELYQKITKASYTPPSVMNRNVPREVQNIVSRCLKKNPADRYQSARELLQDVNCAATGLSLPATRLAGPAPLTAPSSSVPTSPGPRQSSDAASGITNITKPKSVVPMLATPALVPPSPPQEADAGLAQTLWRVKAQVEERASQSHPGALASWETSLTNTARGLGLDVMTWQASIWQLQSLTRPCFIEVLPEPSASRPEIWVLARGVTEGVLIYQEPEGLLTVPLQRLRQVWSGKLYLTLEESKYRGFWLASGMVGTQVRIVQQTLKDLGFFTGPPSGQFDAQTQQAVQRFQRANQLASDGRVGRRTLLLLLHVGADALASTT